MNFIKVQQENQVLSETPENSEQIPEEMSDNDDDENDDVDRDTMVIFCSFISILETIN